ncbi:hypothetical protein OSTOST_19917 [Ostertagia ostertagi]
MRIHSQYPKTSDACQYSLVKSYGNVRPLVWQCCSVRVRTVIRLPELKGLSNSTAYSIGTKESDSTIYATAFPVQKLDDGLTLSEICDRERKSFVSLLYTVAPLSTASV